MLRFQLGDELFHSMKATAPSGQDGTQSVPSLRSRAQSFRNAASSLKGYRFAYRFDDDPDGNAIGGHISAVFALSAYAPCLWLVAYGL